MNILVQFRTDKKKLEECFKLFKQCSDEFNDPEAHAKVSACYYRGIGTEQDKNKSFEYAQKSKEQGSTEGTYWYAVNCWLKGIYIEAFQCFQQLSQQLHSASIFFEGCLEICGQGIPKNKQNGRKKMFPILTSGNGYWTYQYSEILSKGL
jgi:TPR repeat protein